MRNMRQINLIDPKQDKTKPNKDISLINLKKNSKVSHKRAKPPFFGHCRWWTLCFCFWSCTLKCRFGCGKERKAALNKSGFGLKGFTTFQDSSCSHWASVRGCRCRVVSFKWMSCNVRPQAWSHWPGSFLKVAHVSVSQRNMQRGNS